MDECKVSETLENILEAIDTVCDNIAESRYNNDASAASAVFVLARAYDLLAQYDDSGYIEDGEDD